MSGCTSNGGRALHIAVISDKTVSILWRTDPYTCDWEILEQVTNFSPFRREKCVGKRLTLGNRDSRSDCLLRSVLPRAFASKNVCPPE